MGTQRSCHGCILSIVDSFSNVFRLSSEQIVFGFAEELEWQQRELEALEQAEEVERGCQEGKKTCHADLKVLCLYPTKFCLPTVNETDW